MMASKMWKRILAIALALAGMATAEANDSEFYANGCELIPIESADISVRKEVLKIKICEDGYADVDVWYELENKGKERTVLMGFESDAPYIHEDYEGSKRSVRNLKAGIGNEYIKGFGAEVNGKRIAHKVAVVDINHKPSDEGAVKPMDMKVWKFDEEDENTVYKGDPNNGERTQCSYAYHFDAPFKKGMNTIRHRYRYRMMTGVGMTFRIDYKLTPAMRWANKQIDDFTLEISVEGRLPRGFYVRNSALAGITPQIEGTGIGKKGLKCWGKDAAGVFLREGKAVFKAKGFKVSDELKIVSENRCFGGEMTRAEMLSYVKNMTYNADRPCFDAEVKGMTALDRKILHNLPFAARGHVFSNPQLWARVNVGAEKIWEWGDYFAWGETKAKEEYLSENYMLRDMKNDELKAAGVIDENGNLTAEYDAATANWGSEWRMPTKEEIEELLELENEETEVDDWKGRMFYGKNGETLFLPYGGYMDGDKAEYENNEGDYWSATANENDWRADYLLLDSVGADLRGVLRYFGFSVRPVRK